MEKITGVHGVVEIRYFIRTFIVFGVNDMWFVQVAYLQALTRYL